LGLQTGEDNFAVSIMVHKFQRSDLLGLTRTYSYFTWIRVVKNGAGEGKRTLLMTRVADCGPKSGNISYILVSQLLKWQQNWQQTGNRLATGWAESFGFVCRRATASWI
jgi:hypothetical protein